MGSKLDSRSKGRGLESHPTQIETVSKPYLDSNPDSFTKKRKKMWIVRMRFFILYDQSGKHKLVIARFLF